VHRNNIPINIQQDATLHSLFYLETAVHVSGGTITHHQERVQLYLQHLVFVTQLRLSLSWQVAVTVWQIPDAVDTVVCPPDDGWWYHPKHVEQFPDKINCVTLHLIGYLLEQNNQFNIILPSMPRHSKRSLSVRFPHQGPVCTCPVSRTCYMSRLYNYSWFIHL